MAWRIIRDVPGYRLRIGQEVENLPALRQIGKAIAKPLWDFCCPSEAGQHHTERVWPQVLEIPVELGRTLEAEAPDPAALVETEAALGKAREAQAQAGQGLSDCRGRLEEIAGRTRLLGASDQDVAAWKLNLFHEKAWSEKLIAAAAEVSRCEVQLAHLRQAQERASRHQPQAAQEPGGLKTAAQIAQEGPAPNGEPVAAPEDLRRELVRLALVVVQYPDLVDLVGIAEEDRRLPLTPFQFPEPGFRAWVELRRDLLTWAEQTGRSGLALRGLLAEADIRALLDKAVELVEAARAQRAAENHINALQTVEV